MTAPNRQAVTTEEVQIDIRTTAATGEALIRSIELMFEQAARYQATSLGNPVFIRYKENAANDQYRSEILEGTVERDAWHLGPNRQGDTLIVTLIYTRLNFWEATAETELALKNGNEATPGTPQTGGVIIFNCGDGTGTTPAEMRDWVQIAAAAVTGDLPAPIRVELENETAGTPRNRYHWIGLSTLPDPANLAHIFEGEGADGATPVVEAANSGGNYASYTLTSSEATAYTWTFTDAQMDAFGGNWYAVFIRHRVGTLPASGLKLRLQLIYQSTVIWQQDTQQTVSANAADPFSTANNLNLIGVIQIPPAYLGADLQALGLRITAQQAGAGAFPLDYLKLMPMDGFRQLVPKAAYGLAKDETLVDDGMSRPERTYILVGGDKAPQYYPKGQQGSEPIMLYPGALQRLYVAWDAADATAGIARTMTIRIYTRPRRRTL